MPKKKYIVNLNDAEREQLQLLLCSGKHPTRKVTRARILLKAADGCADEQIAAALSVGRATVERVGESFVERALNEQKATIDWQFSLENARTKLKRLYPSTSWWRSARCPSPKPHPPLVSITWGNRI